MSDVTKHTPGPWSVPHFAEPEVNCPCGYVLSDSGMGAICTVHCSGEGDDWIAHGDNPKFVQACANARLISAAPELLEALKACVDGLGCRSMMGASGAIKDALAKGHAAIAKATGAA